MESRTTIERGTTGLRTWLASFVLAHYLTLNPGIYTPLLRLRFTLLTDNQRPSSWETRTGARIGYGLLGYCHRQYPRSPLSLPRCLVADGCRGKRAQSLSRECTASMQ